MAVSDTRSDDSVFTPDAELLRFVITSDLSGQRVDSALAELCGLHRARVSRWVAMGRVRLGEETVARASRRVREGDRLESHPPEPAETEVLPEAIPVEILFEDADLVVVDKRAGMVVHPAPGHSTGTLVNALLHHCGDLAGVGGVLRPGIVHRLDRGTSVVMVVAKNDFSHRRIAEQFHDHSIERIYRVAVRGVPRLDEGRVDRPIGRHLRDRKKMSVRSRSSRPAATRWRVAERFLAPKIAWLEVRPETMLDAHRRKQAMRDESLIGLGPTTHFSCSRSRSKNSTRSAWRGASKRMTSPLRGCSNPSTAACKAGRASEGNPSFRLLRDRP